MVALGTLQDCHRIYRSSTDHDKVRSYKFLLILQVMYLIAKID